MILNLNQSTVMAGPITPAFGFPLSPLLTSAGAESDSGTAASSLHETMVIGGSSSTSMSITGTIDDQE